MSRSSSIFLSCSLLCATFHSYVAAEADTHFSLAAIRSTASGSQDSSGSQTGSVTVGGDWFIPVSIGTPPQSFLFLGDSGAPGLSVASVFLPKDRQPPAAPIYNPNNSTTSKKRDGYTYSLAYVSGATSTGVVYQDVVTIANLTIQDMDIEVQLNNNHNQTGSTSPRSGNLGLCFDHNGQSSKPTKVPTWLQRVMPTLKAGLFTVDLNNDTSSGTFDFGFINSSRYSGEIGYEPVKNGSTSWDVQVTGHQLSNGTVVPTNGWSVVMDTGTAGASLTRSVADDYFGQVNGSQFSQARGTYTYPCSSKLPDFTFVFGDFMGSVPGARLNAGPINGGANCVSRLGVSDNPNNSLWGQLLIEQFFVVFDWNGARVGFADKSNGTVPQTMAPPSSGPTAHTSAAAPAAAVGFRGLSLAVVVGLLLL